MVEIGQQVRMALADPRASLDSPPKLLGSLVFSRASRILEAYAVASLCPARMKKQRLPVLSRTTGTWMDSMTVKPMSGWSHIPDTIPPQLQLYRLLL